MKNTGPILLGLLLYGLWASGPLSPVDADRGHDGKAWAAGTFARPPASGSSAGGASASESGGGETRLDAWSDRPVDSSGSIERFGRNLMQAMGTDKRAREESNVMLHAIYFVRAKSAGIAEPFRNGRPEADFSELFGWFQGTAKRTGGFSPRGVARVYLALKAEYPGYYEEFERKWRPAVIAAGNAAHKENALSERLEGMKKMSEDLME